MIGLSVQNLIYRLNQIEDKENTSVAVYKDNQYVRAKSIKETNAYGGDTCQPTKIVLISYEQEGDSVILND